jgi:hypothetical protein
MGLFIYLNQRYQHHYANNYGQNVNVDDPHQFVGNSPLLAPHGAPTNPKWQTKFSSGNDFSLNIFLQNFIVFEQV